MGSTSQLTGCRVACHQVNALRRRPGREDVERPTQQAKHELFALFRVERLAKPALARLNPA